MIPKLKIGQQFYIVRKHFSVLWEYAKFAVEKHIVEEICQHSSETLYYDKEGDLLELNMGPCTEGRFKNLGDGVFQRVDERTKEIKGLVIMGFGKRMKMQKNLKKSVLTGIQLNS